MSDPEDAAWAETEEAAELRAMMTRMDMMLDRMQHAASVSSGSFPELLRGLFVAGGMPDPSSEVIFHGATADTSQPYPWDAIKAENEARTASLVKRIDDLIGE